MLIHVRALIGLGALLFLTGCYSTVTKVVPDVHSDGFYVAEQQAGILRVFKPNPIGKVHFCEPAGGDYECTLVYSLDK